MVKILSTSRHLGKVGESGVSIATLDDMKLLYKGFDLCAKTTSVSMTINGPAPILLAMYMNTAIDQQMDVFREREGREPKTDEKAGLSKQRQSLSYVEQYQLTF